MRGVVWKFFPLFWWQGYHKHKATALVRVFQKKKKNLLIASKSALKAPHRGIQRFVFNQSAFPKVEWCLGYDKLMCFSPIPKITIFYIVVQQNWHTHTHTPLLLCVVVLAYPWYKRPSIGRHFEPYNHVNPLLFGFDDLRLKEQKQKYGR